MERVKNFSGTFSINNGYLHNFDNSQLNICYKHMYTFAEFLKNWIHIQKTIKVSNLNSKITNYMSTTGFCIISSELQKTQITINSCLFCS